jgi:WD40 repeat protein
MTPSKVVRVILDGHIDLVRSVMYSPNTRQIATSSKDGTVRLWDAQSGAPGRILCCRTDNVGRAVYCIPLMAQQIAFCINDKTVRLWDQQTGAPGPVLRGHTDTVICIVYSHNGKEIPPSVFEMTA